ncbi:hypothetical protein NDU88_001639, partial [Pleurodeles waltl]
PRSWCSRCPDSPDFYNLNISSKSTIGNPLRSSPS